MAKGLTPFGRAVRKYRIDVNATLKDMADWLDISTALLSMIETGDKPVTDAVVAGARRFFEERGCNADDLVEMADRTRTRVDVESLDEEARAAVAEFARRLPDFTGADRTHILDRLLSEMRGTVK